ncbi:hypothetical protein RM717_03615 [Streptomyces griseus]|uniref:Lipoprotein n=3 Tax=Streptomyces TaxID=1883 RepID=A0ABU2VVF0_9ACTN|nr:hypothetical protein [Streptomyces griseus]MDT0489591.1 hypothetical protein [Streptomyces griseus]
MLRSARRAVGAVALGALLAGCGTQHAGEPPQVITENSPASGRSPLSELPTAPTGGLARGLTLPLAEYETGPVDTYVWQVAVQEQWRSCMARYGIEDFGPPPTSEVSAIAQVNLAMGRRYGLSDAEQARKYGYHLPDDLPEPAHWEPEPGLESSLFTGSGPEVENGTHRGKALPQGGCRGEAQRKFPTPRTPEAQELALTVFEQSRKDARVVAAVDKWSLCMKGKGFDRNHPIEDLGAFGIQVSSPTASDEEIAQAVADVECKKSTRLIDIWSTQESGLQEKAIKASASALTNEKNLKDSTIAKARQAYEKAAQG